MTPLRICFIGLKTYDFLAGTSKPRHFGGTERQQLYLARGLTARGHHMSVVTFDYGQRDGIAHDGIVVHKAYSRDAGLPALRFFHPRWTGLDAAMKRADADVYFQMGADSETGQVARFCRQHRRGFLFATASDSDCDEALPRLTQYRRRWLYRYGLKRAHVVITQADGQRTKLERSFGISSTVIRNCTPDPGFDPAIVAERASRARPRLVWVGRFAPVKRLEAFLEMAARCPDFDFDVAGAGDDALPYVRGLVGRGRELPNITLHGALFGDDLNTLYRRANALVCTSVWEGLPNVFLEAWARGLPVVSTVDPDGMITRNALGVAVGEPSELDGAAREVVRQGRLEQTAARVRDYYLANYTVDVSVSAFEREFAKAHALARRS
jgi:glycosyltransferase involved in cell wall biosynthesis